MPTRDNSRQESNAKRDETISQSSKHLRVGTISTINVQLQRLDRAINSEAAGVLQSVMDNRSDVRTKMTTLIELVSRGYDKPYVRIAEAFYQVVNGKLGTNMLNQNQKGILIPATVGLITKDNNVDATDIDKMLSSIQDQFMKLI